MSLQTIIAALVVKQLELPQVVNAFEYLPESVTALPCFVNYPIGGAIAEITNCEYEGTHQIGCDFLVSRGNIASAEEQARPIIEAFSEKLLNDPTVNGTCITAFADPLRYSYLVTEYGNQKVLTVSFVVTVKEAMN